MGSPTLQTSWNILGDNEMNLDSSVIKEVGTYIVLGAIRNVTERFSSNGTEKVFGRHARGQGLSSEYP